MFKNLESLKNAIKKYSDFIENEPEIEIINSSDDEEIEEKFDDDEEMEDEFNDENSDDEEEMKGEFDDEEEFSHKRRRFGEFMEDVENIEYNEEIFKHHEKKRKLVEMMKEEVIFENDINTLTMKKFIKNYGIPAVLPEFVCIYGKKTIISKISKSKDILHDIVNYSTSEEKKKEKRERKEEKEEEKEEKKQDREDRRKKRGRKRNMKNKEEKKKEEKEEEKKEEKKIEDDDFQDKYSIFFRQVKKFADYPQKKMSLIEKHKKNIDEIIYIFIWLCRQKECEFKLIWENLSIYGFK